MCYIKSDFKKSIFIFLRQVSLVWYFCNHGIKAWNHFTKESVPPAVINLYFFLCSDFISDKKDIYYFTLLENTLSWWHHTSRLQMSILCLKEFLLFKESKIASSLSLFDWLTDLIFQEELWSLKNQIYAMRISQFVKTKEFKIFHPIDIFHFKLKRNFLYLLNHAIYSDYEY